ncbi:MAG: DeoR/GlpR family DNA-binding transcription regulator [Pirellulales bacterium]|nr:DeoR/GlpR family DNA-binding transcription regulator [Pirellulales bacterium]
MPADNRRDTILNLVRVRGFASLPDLAEELRVSESTIRRDLDHLEEAGQAKRTHGGVLYTGPSPKLPYFEDRQTAEWDRKKAVAEVAASLIQDGDTLLLGGGSTVYELAQLLVRRPLQIVTNSLPVANLFASSSETDLVLLGGYVYPRTGVALGPYANNMLTQLNVRRTISSTGGVTQNGFYNSNLLLVETERAMMQAADEVIVIADSTKFGHQSLAHTCELSSVDRLIVDDRLDESWQQTLSDAGVELLLAKTADATKTKPRTQTNA